MTQPAPALATVEVETGAKPVGSVIWLHGLGADGHDFEPAVPALVPAGSRALRFVFPHAPVRAVTLNRGARMRAWYDILGFDRHVAQDQLGVRIRLPAYGRGRRHFWRDEFRGP